MVVPAVCGGVASVGPQLVVSASAIIPNERWVRMLMGVASFQFAGKPMFYGSVGVIRMSARTGRGIPAGSWWVGVDGLEMLRQVAMPESSIDSALFFACRWHIECSLQLSPARRFAVVRPCSSSNTGGPRGRTATGSGDASPVG